MEAKKTTKKQQRKTVEKNPYVICRGYRSGVHAGEYVAEHDGWITLRNARRVWYWDGAASLSELAVYGANKEKGKNSRICAVTGEIKLRSDDVSEIIACHAYGERWLREAQEWRA
jgi:hypothetical protein